MGVDILRQIRLPHVLPASYSRSARSDYVVVVHARFIVAQRVCQYVYYFLFMLGFHCQLDW